MFAVKASSDPSLYSTSYILESSMGLELATPIGIPPLSTALFLTIACSNFPSSPRGNAISMFTYPSNTSLFILLSCSGMVSSDMTLFMSSINSLSYSSIDNLLNSHISSGFVVSGFLISNLSLILLS